MVRYAHRHLASRNHHLNPIQKVKKSKNPYGINISRRKGTSSSFGSVSVRSVRICRPMFRPDPEIHDTPADKIDVEGDRVGGVEKDSVERVAELIVV